MKSLLPLYSSIRIGATCLFALTLCIFTSSMMLAAQTNANSQMTAANAFDAMGQKSNQAKKKTAQRTKPKTESKSAKLAAVSAERRAELMDFVNLNHPEIRPLLKLLQKSRPMKYQSTMRTLDREVRTLQNVKAKHPERYDRALEFWTIKSKISLLSAQLAIKRSKKVQTNIEQELDVLIRKRLQIRKVDLEANAARLTAQLERVNSQLEQINGDENKVATRELKKISQQAERLRQTRQKARQAKKKKAKKSEDDNQEKKSTNDEAKGKQK